MAAWKAFNASLSPSIDPMPEASGIREGSSVAPMRIASAVSVQTSPESIEGPIIATRPSRTGSLFFEAPCIIDAVPTPASLTSAARRTPVSAIMMTEPMPPPSAPRGEKAPAKMSRKTPGTRPMWRIRMKSTSRK